MMQYLVSLFISLVLVVVQTALVPDLFTAIRYYDLIIPLAIYFSLYRPFRHGLPVMLTAGIMMDAVSGAPIGVYMTTYFWLFIAFRHTWRWVSVTQHFLFPFIVVVGVFFENLVLWMGISIQTGMPPFASSGMQLVLVQSVWALITSPIFLIIVNAIVRTADNFSGLAKENGNI